MKSKPHLLVCGGGTGGHFFSGLAIAEVFLDLYPEARVSLVGTLKGIEARTELLDPRMSKIFIRSGGVKGKGKLQKISGLLQIALGILQSLQILWRERPDFILGVGGYASAPTLAAAVLLKIVFGWKVLVLDQNSSPGLVNRLFARLKGVVTAYAAFPVKGFRLVNLPLRKKTRERVKNLRPSQWPPKTIFVLGGSQGARGLNQKWMEISPALFQKLPQLEIFHQTGKDDLARVVDFYKQFPGIKAEVFVFSDRMEDYLDRCDLLISRSGAMTVFEALAFQRPSLFVPFPAATDDHQTRNALAVQSPQWVIKESELNFQVLEKLLASPKETAIPHALVAPQTDWQTILSCS